MTDNQNNTPGQSLLLVHGKDFKPSAEDYLEFATTALATGIERDFPEELDAYGGIDVQLCYYGDLTNKLLTYHGKVYDEVLDLGDRRNALGQLRILTKRKHFGVGRYDRLPGKTAVGEFAADVIAPLLPMLGFSKPLVARLSKDVQEYWYGRDNYAEAVRDRVRERLCEAMDRNEKVMLISHGSGCIVTYDVLWELTHVEPWASRYLGQKIDTWVTLGAPMGDRMVRRRMLGANEKGRRRYPGNIVTWHNVSAEDDYLCHDNTLADDYRPMLKQRLVSSIRDYKIYNMCVRYGKSNPHSSLGYFIHPRVAQIIVEWIKSGHEVGFDQNTDQQTPD